VPDKVLINTANAYFEYGVLGISVVVLLLVSAALVLAILKDRKTHKQFADAISKTAQNQKEFTIIYQESQKQHKEILKVLNETLEIERENTKRCYIGVANKLDKLHFMLEKQG